MGRTAKNLVKLPTPAQLDFRRSCVKAGLYLSLTQPMLEALCAVSDGVRPDRWWDYARGANKLGDFATMRALAKRGLVYNRGEAFEADLRAVKLTDGLDFRAGDIEPQLPERYGLTPIGEALVELLKQAGIFVEADQKTYQRAARR